jgi:hypothetical protein
LTEDPSSAPTGAAPSKKRRAGAPRAKSTKKSRTDIVTVGVAARRGASVGDPASGYGGPRSRLLGGAAALLVGLALVGVGPSDAGAGLCLVGLVLSLWSVHSLGRLGPA